MWNEARDHLLEVVDKKKFDPGWKLLFSKVDVTDEDSVNGAVHVVAISFGRVDILLCFAGITESKPAVEYAIGAWRKIFDVNVHGPFLVARAVARSSPFSATSQAHH